MNHITLGIEGVTFQSSLLDELSEVFDREDVVMANEFYWTDLVTDTFDVHDIATYRLKVCKLQGHHSMVLRWTLVQKRAEAMIKDFELVLRFFFPDLSVPQHIEWN